MKAAIIGATGYTGIELLRILQAHPEVEVCCATTESHVGRELVQLYPHLKNSIRLNGEALDIAAIAEKCDVIFCALPHGHATTIVSDLLAAGKKVIDLSADFRLQNSRDYAAWYQATPPPPALLEQAVYGLPEAGQRQRIASARLIANPGCYATAVILATLPAIAANIINYQDCIFDAKSGVSGSGRAPLLASHFCEVAENFKAYQVAGKHRHVPEIEQLLSSVAGQPLRIEFTPHLLPMVRGLFVTAYFKLLTPLTEADVETIYENYYQEEPFVRVFAAGELPQTKNVLGSNYCDIAVRVDTRTQRLLVFCAIDNLIKGAVGTAVQNLNLMSGFNEALGLQQLQVAYP